MTKVFASSPGRLLLSSCLAVLLVLCTSKLTAATVEGDVSQERKQVTTPAGSSNPYQLPKSVLPTNYDLTFTPDLEKFTFEGKGAIDVTVIEPVKSISLNALDLKIKSASIQTTAGSKSQDGAVTVDAEHEQIRITFPQTLPAGNHRLLLAFSGTLNDNLRGFYRSHYKDDTGKKHWIATTQMEPTDARRMFPCFDEPEMKATFKFAATIPQELTAISNGAIERIDSDTVHQTKTVHFEPSPKMSSYLVALIVGDLKSTATRESCGVPVRVWAPAGKEHLGGYALETACKVLEYQTKYFGIPYPGKKLDLIAIPDFRSGAMENLGAITFREAALLFDDKTGSSFLKRRVSGIVAHEIAHQWFGDLVTMKWWDDIWLNEAFASWMATKTVDAIHPDWQEITKSVLTRNESMNIDQLAATRAIHAKVDNPKQAAEMFDPITYDKGESVLRMLEGFVGDKSFQAGINDYLNAHKFANATSEDLWLAIGKKSNGLPVPEIMKTWVFQPGFPVISKGKVQSGKLALSQGRFFGTPGESGSPGLWRVPLVLRTPGSKQGTSVVLTKTDEMLTLPQGTQATNETLLNGGGMGYYRSRYSDSETKTITKNFERLTPEERLAFIDDIAALVWNDSLPVENRLDLTTLIPKESDSLVQKGLIVEAQRIFDFAGEKQTNLFAKKFHPILIPVKEKIGWSEQPGEADTVKDLREALLTLLGYSGDKATIAEARELFKKYMENRQSVDPNIAGTILSIVAYNGGLTEYDQIADAWKKERIPELEKRFLLKLAVFRQPDLVDKTLNLSIGPDVRAQDGFRLLGDLLSNQATKERALTFIKAHWQQISEKFPPRSLSNIAAACSSFDTASDEKALKEFFHPNLLPQGKATVARMLEEVHAAVLYRQRNEQKIASWMSK